MNWKLSLVITVISVLLIASCSKPGSEATSESQPAVDTTPHTVNSGGSDPTIVDPDHYTTEFENDAVRIVRIEYGAGEQSVMHYHPDAVAVFLTDQLAQMTLSDGSTQELPATAGDALFTPGGEHLPKNILESPLELVLVELKQQESTAVESSGPSAIDVDPGHYTAEFENEAVRILRIVYGAGEESPMHYHPDNVAVFLTDHLVEMTLPDGSKEEISANAGDAIFVPAGQHSPKNISDSEWELVLIELK